MFDREYTKEELNRGIGMVFHPLCGIRLDALEYDRAKSQFITRSVNVAWLLEEVVIRSYHCIADSRDIYMKGDALPSHWVFDPWTGLQRSYRWY